MSFLRLSTVVGLLAREKKQLNLRREFSDKCPKVVTSIPKSYSDSTVKLAYSVYEPTGQQGHESSEKPPIVVIHGVFGSRKNWVSLSKILSERTNRKVISPDLRNHGESPHTPEFTYEHMGADMNRLLNDLGIDRAVLIGHSMGARLMMYLALTRPKFVEKLIAIDMSPTRTGKLLSSLMKIGQVMKNIRFEEAASLSEARKVAHSQLSVIVASEPIRQHLIENIVESSESGKCRWCVNLSALSDNVEVLSGLTCVSDESKFFGPTLFVRGIKADVIIDEDYKKIKEFFPAAKIECMDAGHWLHQQKQQEFLDIIVPFINEIN